MALIELNTNPTIRQLRQFGGLWLGVLSLLAALAWRSGRPVPVAAVLAALAVLVPAIGWVAPRFLRWVWIGMSLVAWPIGTAVSFTVLTLVFLAVVTPLGLVMRLLGRDPLDRRIEPESASYWTPRSGEGSADLRRYLRQF
jgi:hypothetical protein